MNEDFVTQLRLQLREVALRDERRGPVALRAVRARRNRPGPAPMAAALAAALLALAVAFGALALRDEPEPAAPKLIGAYRVASGLSSLASGFGAVWTADPIRSEVLRIDPGTRRVVTRIPVGGEARVATGAGAVWAIAGDLQYGGDQGPIRLLRIDPDTDRVVARIPMRTPAGARFAPVDLRINRDAVWAIGTDGALRIDPRTNLPDRYLPLAGERGDPRGIVIDGGHVWALTAAGRLRLYDARDGRPAGEVRVQSPTPPLYLFGGPRGTLTLLLAKNELALVERASGRARWRATLGDDIGWLHYHDGMLWAQVADPPTSSASGPAAPDRLVQLDADSGRRRGQVKLPEAGVAGMADVGREIWVATPGGAILVVR